MVFIIFVLSNSSDFAECGGTLEKTGGCRWATTVAGPWPIPPPNFTTVLCYILCVPLSGLGQTQY